MPPSLTSAIEISTVAAGIDFALSGPQELIDDEYLAESLTLLAIFGAAFHATPHLQMLLDAIGEALRAPRPTVN